MTGNTEILRAAATSGHSPRGADAVLSEASRRAALRRRRVQLAVGVTAATLAAVTLALLQNGPARDSVVRTAGQPGQSRELETSAPHSTVAGTHCLKGFDALEPDAAGRYLGRTVSEAEDVAIASGMAFRVIAVDGKCEQFTDDLSNRIDVVVVDGIVRAVGFG